MDVSPETPDRQATRKRTLSIRLTLGQDELSIRGPITLQEAKPFVDQFVNISTAGLQAQIDHLTARLSSSTDRLERSVGASRPQA